MSESHRKFLRNQVGLYGFSFSETPPLTATVTATHTHHILRYYREDYGKMERNLPPFCSPQFFKKQNKKTKDTCTHRNKKKGRTPKNRQTNKFTMLGTSTLAVLKYSACTDINASIMCNCPVTVNC